MKIHIEWSGPFELVEGSEENLTYCLEDEDKNEIPDEPGVYIFGRLYDNNIVPLYIGLTEDNLADRIGSQIKHNVALMNGIENARRGKRVVLAGEVKVRPGQKLKQVVRIVESALIEHCLAEGYDILNKQGKKRDVHEISFAGCQKAKNLTGPKMKVRRGD